LTSARLTEVGFSPLTPIYDVRALSRTKRQQAVKREGEIIREMGRMIVPTGGQGVRAYVRRRQELERELRELRRSFPR
jgi:hypothetical protein